MKTMLRDSINLIRTYQHACKSKSSSADSKAYAKLIIEREWKNVKLYRSQERIELFLIKGLYEQDLYLRGKEALCYMLEQWDYFEGMNFTIEVVTMTGREFGRLPVHQDYEC